MKPYGLPNNDSVNNPDVADIGEYARPGRCGHLPGKGGDIRSYFKNAAAKATTRRLYKRRARREGRVVCSVVS